MKVVKILPNVKGTTMWYNESIGYTFNVGNWDGEWYVVKESYKDFKHRIRNPHYNKKAEGNDSSYLIKKEHSIDIKEEAKLPEELFEI